MGWVQGAVGAGWVAVCRGYGLPIYLTSEWLQDLMSPLALQAGCSMFGAWGTATADPLGMIQVSKRRGRRRKGRRGGGEGEE